MKSQQPYFLTIIHVGKRDIYECMDYNSLILCYSQQAQCLFAANRILKFGSILQGSQQVVYGRGFAVLQSAPLLEHSGALAMNYWKRTAG